MAWTNLTFPYGSQLPSVKMTQLYENISDVAVAVSGIGGALLNMTCHASAIWGAGYTVNHIGNFASFAQNNVGDYTFTFAEAFPTINAYGVQGTVQTSGDPFVTFVTCWGNFYFGPPYGVTVLERTTAHVRVNVWRTNYIDVPESGWYFTRGTNYADLPISLSVTFISSAW
jgi:hypothetical protein